MTALPVPGTPEPGGAPVRYDLSLSENPFPPLPSVLRALSAELPRTNLYPEFEPRRLPRLIAEHVGVTPDQVVVGTGATGVTMQIMQTLAAPGRRMVFATPTFDGYPIMAAMTGLESVGIPLDSSGRQRLWEMAAAIDDRTDLVAVCRPHNPTGTVVSGSELKAFLHAVPARIPVILDEAYVEFLGAADVLDVVELVRRHPNLLVLRTFSKAYGLAGLRVGYAVGSEELMRRVRRLQLPFGMPSGAVAAVAASYAAADELAMRVLRITTERELLRTRLRRSGIRVPRGSGNFLYLPGSDVAAALARAGIVAKRYPDGSARIAVGEPAAGRAVLRALTHGPGAARRPLSPEDSIRARTVRAADDLSRRSAPTAAPGPRR
ncbi:aminotransferase class I/II-fold pyridoxal phosphate-dependent enzyme [Nocardia otitidiscaviarum]|uniref:aminotransferase class I/II-fold pyridoxal phosphate-dependent enzyme n=1 Tax=Nocardia otitidiscaviarum TaxID=1823 RepID=UPI0018938A90|nr:aminotransferase class I/II-fold pyridoxal phosphate-dependent enzyme [Nocardia otitidiscaviarum]MBF6183294.1 aminotransferase class I/II-fold pyridoxal phosphate-dependent enzyme [Nocardia otitidiscaviarum]